jgi:predicted ATPase
LRHSQGAVALAQELDHPYSQVVAQSYAAMLHQFRREPRATQAWAEAVLALCADHGFAYYAAWATLLQGWAVAEQGESEAGIVQMQQGLAALRAMGAGLREPYYLGLLAEAHGRGGHIAAGLRLLDEALAIVHENEEGATEAESYRLQGELLWRQGADEHEVEVCFRQASAVARQQQARSLELRAATSLARLWQRQGRGEAARQQLAACYHWLTEGFDTLDLQEAKDLLNDLGRAQ